MIDNNLNKNILNIKIKKENNLINNFKIIVFYIKQ